MNNEKIMTIAKSYVNILNLIDWNDEIMIQALKEGLNKFLSNAFLSENERSKYKSADYYSHMAYEKVKLGIESGLVYEHMVPKQKYIQSVCVESAKGKNLTLDFVVDLLRRYWKIAVVTKEENVRLRKYSMPDFWDGKNIFARYQDADIKLIQSPFLSADELWGRVFCRIDSDGGVNNQVQRPSKSLFKIF
jgi:hypothetical protein